MRACLAEGVSEEGIPWLTSPGRGAMFVRERKSHSKVLCAEHQRLIGPWAVARGLFCFWISNSPGKRDRHGSHAERERPTGLRPEEVPPPDRQGRPVPGFEAEALLRESLGSPAAEGQGSCST